MKSCEKYLKNSTKLHVNISVYLDDLDMSNKNNKI